MKIIILLINFLIVFLHTFAYSFSYEPKELVWINDKDFKINLNTKILVDNDYGRELEQFTQMLRLIGDFDNRIIKIGVLPFDEKRVDGNIIIGSPSLEFIKKILRDNNIKLQHEEGYAIIIDEHYFIVTFNSKRAFSYALKTIEEILLMSHIKIMGRNIYFSVPCMRIHDFPSFSVRAIHVTLFDTLDVMRLKKIVDMASKERFNTIILAINNGLRYNSHPEISRKNALSKEQILELIRYARERHLEVIPHLDLLGHQEWLLSPAYPELIIKEGILSHSPNMFHTYDPRNEQVYKIIYDILNEIIEVFQPHFIHIGHDEVFGLRVFDEPESYQLFAEHINKINEFLSQNGIKAMIWGDMLKKEHNGAQKSIYKAIDLISKDVIIVDWIYFPQKDYPSIRYFMEKGFKVMRATFKNEAGIKAFANFMKKQVPKPVGMVATTWYYLPWNKMELLERLIKVSGKNFW